MASYTKTTNFSAKDALPTGDPNKIIAGSLFDTEFDELETAVNSKSDSASPTFTGTVTIPNLVVNTTADFTGASVSGLSLTTVDVDGGTIDGATIGATTPAAGSFTTLSATGTTTLAGMTASTGDFSGDVTIDGNTTIGDATGDSLTVNASTWSTPNNFSLNTTDLVLEANKFGQGVSPYAWAGSDRGFDIGGGAGIHSRTGAGTRITQNLYEDGTDFRYKEDGSGLVVGLSPSNNYSISMAVSGLSDGIATPVTVSQVIDSGYSKFSDDGTYNGVTGTYHEFNQSINNLNVLARLQSDSGSSFNFYSKHDGNFSSAFHYSAENNGLIVYQVLANGNVQNTNNSYGAISSREYKNNIVDATPKLEEFLKIRYVNYNLKEELGYDTRKQFGVVSEELKGIFPSLVEESSGSVNYSTLNTMQGKALQEMYHLFNSRFEEQESEIKKLRRRLKKLEGEP